MPPDSPASSPRLCPPPPHRECRRPSRTRPHPCCSRWRIKSCRSSGGQAHFLERPASGGPSVLADSISNASSRASRVIVEQFPGGWPPGSPHQDLLLDPTDPPLAVPLSGRPYISHPSASPVIARGNSPLAPTIMERRGEGEGPRPPDHRISRRSCVISFTPRGVLSRRVGLRGGSRTITGRQHGRHGIAGSYRCPPTSHLPGLLSLPSNAGWRRVLDDASSNHEPGFRRPDALCGRRRGLTK